MIDDSARMAAAVALREMFNNQRINICSIDEIAKRFSVVCEKDSYGTLHLLHCVKFADMPQELVAKLPALIATCLGGLSLDVIAIEALLPKAKKTDWTTPDDEKDVTPPKATKLLDFFRRTA